MVCTLTVLLYSICIQSGESVSYVVLYLVNACDISELDDFSSSVSMANVL